VTLITSKDAGQ